jgi:cytochrome c553
MKYTALASLFALTLVAAPAHADGDARAGETKAQICVACHGPAGNSMIPTFPHLAGQHAKYTAKQLADFKAGTARSAPEMIGMVANLTEQDMADIAAYYAKQPPKVGQADAKLAELGEKLYRGGNRAKGVAACIACHGPAGAGNPMTAHFPRLSGQHTMYVSKALKDFREGKRSNDLSGMMRDIAGKLSDAEIEALAAYIAGLH